jgi:hypothetical protein
VTEIIQHVEYSVPMARVAISEMAITITDSSADSSIFFLNFGTFNMKENKRSNFTRELQMLLIAWNFTNV